MSQQGVKDILSTSITLCRPSTEEEQKIFSDKRGGYFYTLGLASGQKFAAHLSYDAEKEQNVFTLYPTNNLLPDLKEIQWIESPYIGGSGVETKCRFVDGISEEKKAEYQHVLGDSESKWVHIQVKSLNLLVGVPHPILKKLSQIQDARQACEKAQQDLLASQNILKALEVWEDKASVEQPKRMGKCVRSGHEVI